MAFLDEIGLERLWQHIVALVQSKTDLTDGEVTAEKIADGAVTTSKIDSGAITEAEISSNAVTAEKIADGAVSQNVVLVLLAASWINNAQSVNVAAVTAENTVFVSPVPDADNYAAYTDSAIRCTAQSSGRLAFVCEDVPTEDVTVNVTVINK